MLPRSAKRILRALKKSDNGSLNVAELAEKTGITPDEVRNACDYLIDVGFIRRGKKREFTPEYFDLTARGRYRFFYAVNNCTDFLTKSLVVPIIVSVAAALIVLLFQCT